MEQMTAFSRQMYQEAAMLLRVEEAAEVLRQYGHFRRFGDILRDFSAPEDARAVLLAGLSRNHPQVLPQSLDRKIRNWLNGRTDTVARSDAFEICQIFRLDLERTDLFLRQVTDEGIHWRDPREIIWAYCIFNGYSYEQSIELHRRAEEYLQAMRSPLPSDAISYTADVRERILPLLGGSEEVLLEHLGQTMPMLGKLHNTAYSLFRQYLQILEYGDGHRLTIRQILEQYLYRKLIPVSGHDRLGLVQKNIRQHWPDETTLSKMKNRDLDIPRKVLILLFLATDGSDSEYGEPEDEGVLSRDELFQNIHLRLNRMLRACGYHMLDPRCPFDWMILYCICVDDVWDVDQRLLRMLEALFPPAEPEL